MEWRVTLFSPKSYQMNLLEVGLNKKTVLSIGYLFVFLILIDFPLVILYTFTRSAFLVKILLYGSEAIIMIIFVYLLLNSFQMGLPVFIYIFVGYIILYALGSFLLYDFYAVARDSRRFLGPLPPLLLGCYFACSFGEKRESYVNKIVVFLTILSVISLVEWILFYLFYHPMFRFYAKYFQTGAYYSYIKHTSNISETGVLSSGLTQHGIFIPGFFRFKRATGLYMEGYSAGFNAVTAIILILYSKIAGYRAMKMKRNYIFIIVNLIAVILATSRSAYLLLFVSLFGYAMIQRRLPAALFLCLLPFIYTPFRDFVSTSVKTLGGGVHRDAIVLLPNFLFSHIFSFEGLMGSGIGSFKGYTDAGGIKDIFIQLGLLGLFSFFLLHFIIMANIDFSRENKFFILTVSIAIFLLSIYSGRIFGYKCLGVIYFFLGYIMKPHYGLPPHKK